MRPQHQKVSVQWATELIVRRLVFPEQTKSRAFQITRERCPQTRLSQSVYSVFSSCYSTTSEMKRGMPWLAGQVQGPSLDFQHLGLPSHPNMYLLGSCDPASAWSMCNSRELGTCQNAVLYPHTVPRFIGNWGFLAS